jgi:hypothetical protein
VAAQAGGQWNVVWLPATDRDSHTAAHMYRTSGPQRPAASRFDEMMLRHELQVGTAAAGGETMQASHLAGAAFRQVNCTTTTPRTC